MERDSHRVVSGALLRVLWRLFYQSRRERGEALGILLVCAWYALGGASAMLVELSGRAWRGRRIVDLSRQLVPFERYHGLSVGNA